MKKLIYNHDGSEHMSRVIAIAIAFVAIGILIAAVAAAINSGYADGIKNNILDFMW